jgi:hypothetical protein
MRFPHLSRIAATLLLLLLACAQALAGDAGRRSLRAVAFDVALTPAPAPAPARIAPIAACKAACNATFAPVCGRGGTYLNACWAGCMGSTPSVAGECAESADRFRRTDGLCEAKCAAAADGVWAPACGENGFTYGSACVAKCSGVSVTVPGNCCAHPQCVVACLSQATADARGSATARGQAQRAAAGCEQDAQPAAHNATAGEQRMTSRTDARRASSTHRRA